MRCVCVLVTATTFGYTDRDVILYALSVGASQDPLNPDELKFTYELGSEPLTPLPTFGVLFGFGAMAGIMDVSALQCAGVVICGT